EDDEDDENENSVDYILFKDLESHLANGGINLLSIDSVVSEDSNRVMIELDADGDLRIEGFRPGRTQVRADFTYTRFGEHKYHSAFLSVYASVDEDCNIELGDYSFHGIDDEPGENGQSNSDTWEKIGSFLNGAASFLGGFVAGYQNTRDAFDYYDDDDD
ncbi:MAG: hypothetical protein J5784_02550, partial [Muribaculaceae bacterium]|nr:hypothetical protein [Muribaculaceae bacterium]